MTTGDAQDLPPGARRRIRCVSCRAIFDVAPSTRCLCPQCGLTLRIREHWSPRLGAWMGVPVEHGSA